MRSASFAQYSRKENMVEKREIIEREISGAPTGVVQVDPVVENLVMQLGVPVDSVGNIAKALDAVLGDRTTKFLEFKLARRKEQL